MRGVKLATDKKIHTKRMKSYDRSIRFVPENISRKIKHSVNRTFDEI